MTRVVSTRADLASAYAGVAGRRAVVMTMGALHEGHLHLVREARRLVGDDGHVTVTVFVNPTQFLAGEDFEKYPRSLERDVAGATSAGADLVFAPTPDVVYPYGDPTTVTVDPGDLGTELEGEVRPGHFRGVLTVVLKLLHLTGPDVALFGEKDYQQLVLIARMVRELDVPTEIVGVPTVRAEDGLALSSRNAYLSADERRLAAVVPRALEAGIAVGARGAYAAESAARAVLEEAGLAPDYVAVRGVELGPAPDAGAARILVAVRVGSVRLIDNRPIVLGEAA